MCATMTQEAKEFRDMLVREGIVSIFFEGLMGDSVWMSSNRRAYRLKDLSDGHLSNIILKYYKNEEEVPQCLIDERDRRR